MAWGDISKDWTVPQGWRTLVTANGVFGYDPYDFSKFKRLGDTPDLKDYEQNTEFGFEPRVSLPGVSSSVGFEPGVIKGENTLMGGPGMMDYSVGKPMPSDPHFVNYLSDTGKIDKRQDRYHAAHPQGGVADAIQPLLKLIPSAIVGMVPYVGPYLAAGVNMALSGAEAGGRAWDIDRLVTSGLAGYGAGTIGSGISGAAGGAGDALAGGLTDPDMYSRAMMDSSVGGGIESGYGFGGQIGTRAPLMYGSPEFLDAAKQLGMSPEQAMSLTDKSLGGVSAMELAGQTNPLLKKAAELGVKQAANGLMGSGLPAMGVGVGVANLPQIYPQAARQGSSFAPPPPVAPPVATMPQSSNFGLPKDFLKKKKAGPFMLGGITPQLWNYLG